MAQRLTSLGCRVSTVCSAVSVSRATYYRHIKPVNVSVPKERSSPANRLSESEVQAIKNVLHESRFIDLPPREIVPTLADEGRYLGSIRTFYRILHDMGESQDRRFLARHPRRQAPILEALGPNQVWTWDITRLKGPYRGKFYYLYVMIDIFTRYVVGWMVAERENARRAQNFIRETVRRHVEPGHKLTIHNDRGSPMKAGGTRELINLLGLEHSFSRPRTSDDNPYSESQFKTLKYHSRFPAFFDSIQDSESYLSSWFQWYNHEHRHTGLNLHTPASVHFEKVAAVVEHRQKIMDEAYAMNPYRFPRGRPVVLANPSVVGINLMYKTTPVNVEALENDSMFLAGITEGNYTN